MVSSQLKSADTTHTKTARRTHLVIGSRFFVTLGANVDRDFGDIRRTSKVRGTVQGSLDGRRAQTTPSDRTAFCTADDAEVWYERSYDANAPWGRASGMC